MSKGNPIVGLAHVVVSQQEMLEKAYEQIEELKKELVSLDSIKTQKLEDVYKDFQEASEKRAQAEELCERLKEKVQNEKDQCNYFSEECDRIKKQLLDLKDQLQRERSNPFHWQKWEEGKEFPLDKFGNVPMVDGLYLFNDDSKRTVWIEKEHRCVPLAGKYSVDYVNSPVTEELKDRGVFTISPLNSTLSDGTLVAVNIRSIAEATLLDSMPELIDEE